MRHQEEGESVDAYITDLYALAEHCDYGALHNETIRDRIVVGIRNRALSEKMQLDSKLTLDSAVTQVRQSEAVKLQQSVLRGSSPPEKTDIPIGAVHRKPGARGSRARARAVRTVWPQTTSLITPGGVPGVARSLPLIRLIVLLRMPSAENAIQKAISKLCADQPEWEVSRATQVRSFLELCRC